MNKSNLGKHQRAMALVQEGRKNKAEICDMVGISRPTLDDWLKKKKTSSLDVKFCDDGYKHRLENKTDMVEDVKFDVKLCDWQGGENSIRSHGIGLKYPIRRIEKPKAAKVFHRYEKDGKMVIDLITVVISGSSLMVYPPGAFGNSIPESIKNDIEHAYAVFPKIKNRFGLNVDERMGEIVSMHIGVPGHLIAEFVKRAGFSGFKVKDQDGNVRARVDKSCGYELDFEFVKTNIKDAELLGSHLQHIFEGYNFKREIEELKKKVAVLEGGGGVYKVSPKV